MSSGSGTNHTGRDLKELSVELSHAEKGCVEAKEKLSTLRRQWPNENVGDYTFTAFDGSLHTLSELFLTKREMILVHNMGTTCTYCTMWADGFNGLLPHLEDRAAFVVVSPDASEVQQKFAKGRRWAFRMYSTQGTTFNRDMGFEAVDGKPMPGVSTFERADDGKVSRVAKASFGPGDDYCATWHLFDLLPGGSKGWVPKFAY